MGIRMALIIAALMLACLAFGANVLSAGDTNGFTIASDGTANRGVVATGPIELTALGVHTTATRGWSGCGYTINWGDGVTTPQSWMGSDCGRALRHAYSKPGVYHIQASVNVPREDVDGEKHWSGKGDVDIR